MTGLLVTNGGLLALLQDGGRYGYHRVGLTTGGPMDRLAFQWANVLCGNTEDATAIELTVGGLAATVMAPSCIAVTGADITFTINGVAAQMWRSHKVQRGDEIRFGFSRNGCRVYLAVAGGFSVNPQFGSSATVVREGFGGLTGAALQAGDQLQFPAFDKRACCSLPAEYRPHYGRDITVRALLTYQSAIFSDQLRQFLATTYTVSKHCDRMAYRLFAEPALGGLKDHAMVSEGVSLGAVQIPPDGQPIVMMNDRQTMGGYPKNATVLSIDLAKLAQLVEGDTVRFQLIEPEQARDQLLLSNKHFEIARTKLEHIA